MTEKKIVFPKVFFPLENVDWRDILAAMAMHSMLGDFDAWGTVDEVSELAYMAADAMIKQSTKDGVSEQ